MSANTWPKGRRIPGSGRKKGTPNKPKRDRLADRARRVGGKQILPDIGTDPDVEPLDFLLAVMRRADLPIEVRMHAARCAAPYRHRALKSVEVNTPEDAALRHTVEVHIVDHRPSDGTD